MVERKHEFSGGGNRGRFVFSVEADFLDSSVEADLDGVFHGREKVTNFLRLGKENFVRAELSIHSLHLHSAGEPLRPKDS